MNDERDPLRIWRQVCETDSEHAKWVEAKKQTAIKPPYRIFQATRLWGPMGGAWGYRVIEHGFCEGVERVGERYPAWDRFDKKGSPDKVRYREMLFWVLLRLWYPNEQAPGGRGEVEHFGAHKVVYEDSRGSQFDDDALKSAVTDAMGKCLSLLGFNADVYLGDFERPEYQAALAAKKAVLSSIEVIQKAATLEAVVAEFRSAKPKLEHVPGDQASELEGALTQAVVERRHGLFEQALSLLANAPPEQVGDLTAHLRGEAEKLGRVEELEKAVPMAPKDAKGAKEPKEPAASSGARSRKKKEQTGPGGISQEAVAALRSKVQAAMMSQVVLDPKTGKEVKLTGWKLIRRYLTELPEDMAELTPEQLIEVHRLVDDYLQEKRARDSAREREHETIGEPQEPADLGT